MTAKLFSLFLLLLISTFSAHTAELKQVGNSQYYVSAAENSYLEAMLLCQQQGMDLIDFSTEEKFLQFNKTMNRWGINNAVTYWIGGFRLKNGMWYWTSTKSEFTYTNWGTNEPKCPTDTDCCTEMGNFNRLSYSEPRKWCAETCSKTMLYICERQ